MNVERKAAPLVSIIVPVYNVEKYLSRCLDSIVGQTYHNLEIILVNDGSTDNSKEICLRYARSDARICLITQDNSGPSAARNTGLDHMKGEYVAFVDADDYISPYMVEILLSQLLKHRAAVAVCDFLVVGDEEDHAPLDMPPENGLYISQKMTRDEVFDTIGTDFGLRFHSIMGEVYAKSIFENLRFKVGRIYEDAFIYHRVYAQVEWVCYVDLKLCAYKMSTNSMTRKDGADYRVMDVLAEMWLERLEFFQQYGVEKHIRCVERQLFSELALYSPADTPKEQRKQLIKETETKVYQITGKKFFSCRWTLFKISPKAYRFVRKCYWSCKDLMRSLQHEEST